MWKLGTLLLVLFWTSLGDAFICDGKPWVLNKDDGNCYYYVNSYRSFAGAEDYCKEFDSFAHLASVHSRKSFIFVSNFIRQRAKFFSSDNSVWIGGFAKNNDTWSWTDSSPYNYAIWTPRIQKKPFDTKDRIVMHFSRRYKKGPWDHADSIAKLTFICMRPEKPDLVPKYDLKSVTEVFYDDINLLED